MNSVCAFMRSWLCEALKDIGKDFCKTLGPPPLKISDIPLAREGKSQKNSKCSRKERKRGEKRRRILGIQAWISSWFEGIKGKYDLLSLILWQEHANIGLNMYNDGFIKDIHVCKYDFKLGFAS